MPHEMTWGGAVLLPLPLNSGNPILAHGAAFGDGPMLAGFDQEITATARPCAPREAAPAATTLKAIRRPTEPRSVPSLTGRTRDDLAEDSANRIVLAHLHHTERRAGD